MLWQFLPSCPSRAARIYLKNRKISTLSVVGLRNSFNSLQKKKQKKRKLSNYYREKRCKMGEKWLSVELFQYNLKSSIELHAQSIEWMMKNCTFECGNVVAEEELQANKQYRLNCIAISLNCPYSMIEYFYYAKPLNNQNDILMLYTDFHRKYINGIVEASITWHYFRFLALVPVYHSH